MGLFHLYLSERVLYHFEQTELQQPDVQATTLEQLLQAYVVDEEQSEAQKSRLASMSSAERQVTKSQSLHLNDQPTVPENIKF